MGCSKYSKHEQNQVARMLEMRRVQQIAQRKEMQPTYDTYYGETDVNEVRSSIHVTSLSLFTSSHLSTGVKSLRNDETIISRSKESFIFYSDLNGLWKMLTMMNHI